MEYRSLFKLKVSFLVQTLTLLVPFLAQAGFAHDFSSSYSHFQVDGNNLTIEFTINLADLHAGPNSDINGDGQTSANELEAVINELFEAVVQNFQVRAPDLPAQTNLKNYTHLLNNTARLYIAFTFQHPVREFWVNSTLDLITQDNHRHLLQLGQESDSYHKVLSRDQPEVFVNVGDGFPLFRTIQEFIELGFKHIFSGYDHLAFLVGLLLAITTIGSLVKLVTAFTVGHSLTLGLATFDLVVLPAPLIESLIALTIAYIAIESFCGYTLAKRWKITFLFGLIHGFGFSNLLRGMALNREALAVSLFSFNAGVEIGQILFICTLLPFMLYLKRLSWGQTIVEVLSIGIMSLGFFWFFKIALLPYFL